MYYFAYGANMDDQTLRDRGVEFTKVTTGKVRHVRLVFHKPGADGTGKADLQDDRGSAVEGVVWDVPEQSLARLDVYEGVEKGHYRRFEVTVQTSKGELACNAYRALKFRSGLKPSRDYLEILVRGAEAHRLSADYVTFIKAHGTMDAAGA